MADAKERVRNINISPGDIIEAGELANVVGKYLLKDLETAINNHRGFNKDKLYFICQLRKDPTNLNKLHLNVGVTDIKLQLLKEATDLWEYDYRKEKLELLWSVPHKTEMKNFLREPEKYSKDLISWIKTYVKQENINLKDKSSQVVIQ